MDYDDIADSDADADNQMLMLIKPILVIFSSAFRVIASSPLLSDFIQGVYKHNNITIFLDA